MKLITIYGQRRTGSHAIANWITSHFKTSCYINDSYRKIRIQSNELPSHKSYSIKTNLDNYPEIIVVGVECRTDRNVHDSYMNYLKSIYNVDSIDSQEICLIRHCPNLLASHLKAWGEGTYHEKIPDVWKKFIDFYSNNKTQIYRLVYDHWLDTEFTDAVAKDIGFDNHNLGTEQIPNYGGGSSFKDQVVNKLDLKNRWKNMLNNNRFTHILQNFKYWDDHKDIFGYDEAYQYFNKSNISQLIN